MRPWYGMLCTAECCGCVSIRGGIMTLTTYAQSRDVRLSVMAVASPTSMGPSWRSERLVIIGQLMSWKSEGAMAMAHKIVGRYETRCSKCGGNANPDESWHFHGGPGSMWGKYSTLDDIN